MDRRSISQLTGGGHLRTLIKSHRELDVYKRAFAIARRVFVLSKQFPKEEKYSLTDQIRRSSRSICANLAEAWRKRRYEAAFISKLCDCEAETAETQVWLEFALDCEYVGRDEAKELFNEYEAILGSLVGIIDHANDWILPQARRR